MQAHMPQVASAKPRCAQASARAATQLLTPTGSCCATPKRRGGPPGAPHTAWDHPGPAARPLLHRRRSSAGGFKGGRQGPALAAGAQSAAGSSSGAAPHVPPRPLGAVVGVVELLDAAAAGGAQVNVESRQRGSSGGKRGKKRKTGRLREEREFNTPHKRIQSCHPQHLCGPITARHKVGERGHTGANWPADTPPPPTHHPHTGFLPHGVDKVGKGEHPEADVG